MQQPSNQSSASNELTLPNINKALKRWMNKQDKTDIEEQSNIIVSNALEVVYQELRRLFAEGENGIHFEEVMRIYIDLFQSAGNNKHRFFVEKHMRELLKSQSYHMYKRSQKYYDFFGRIFEYYPFLVFRLLQSQFKIIFKQSLDEVFRLFNTYIRFATSRKNFKLIQQYIQEEINSDEGSIDKMNILLQSYIDLGNIIKQNMLKQIIKLVMDYNNKAQSFKWNIKETKMQSFCETLFKIQWSPSLQIYKSRFALSVIKKWESKDNSMPANKCINIILSSVKVDEYIRPQLQQAVRNRLYTFSTSPEHFGLNCEFTRIVLSKLTRFDAQKIISKDQYLGLSKQISQSIFNREQSILLLDVIRQKEVYQLSDQIQEGLIEMINRRLRSQRGYISDIHAKDKQMHQLNLIFALKAIVIYKFKKFNVIYSDYKKLILRDNKIMKQSGLELKTECLKVCLHYLRYNIFESSQEERHAFKDIIDLVGTSLALKQVMIEYIVQHLQERFFDHSQIYMIYRENKYEYLLFEDFTTNELSVRIFSIKIISYLAENIHQYRFFIKNAYKVLYDRLSIKGLLRSEEKLTALRLIRELMRYRGQIFDKEADDLAILLIDELHKSIEFHSPQMNNISGYILRIFQAMMRKLPQKMVRYVPCLARYAVDILNYRIIKKQLKKQTVITLCEMTDSCRYVILPYFHFPDLYSIIRQMLLADDHYYYYQDLMLRLIGRIGYIGYEEFMGLQLLNLRNGNNIEQNFKLIFGQTYFIKEYEKSAQTHLDIKQLIIQDVYYNQSKMSNTSIQLETYVEYIITTIVNNLSLSIVETALVKSLETIVNLIPVLETTQHQKLLHKHLLSKLIQIQEKYSNEVITIIDELLKYHDIQTWCVDVFKFYLKKVYNHKREDDIIRLICAITQKYAQSVSKEIVNLIIIVKKIIIDSVEERKHQDKIRHCFTIIINMGEKVDEVLHLFFTDIIKMFSYNYDKMGYDLSSRSMDDIPDVILQIYLTFLMQLIDLCPSSHYFLPSIRQFLILYFNRQINKLKGRQGKRELYYIRYEKKLLNKIVDAMIYLMIKYSKQCEAFIHLLHTSLRAHRIHHKLYNIAENYLKKQSSLDLMGTAFEQQNVKIVWEYNNRNSQVRPESKANKLPEDPKKKIIKQFQSFVLNPNHTVEQDQLWLDNLALELFNNSQVDILRACGQLAGYDKLFRYNLFQIPFYFFWKGLYEKVEPSIYTYDDFDNLQEVKPLYVPNQEVTRLTSKIRTILSRKEYSLKVRQKLLQCIYFIERYQIPFMIKDKVLYDIAVAVEDSVKAMFYLQRQYQNDPDVYRECLIERYAQIGLNESAAGLFKSLKNIDSVNKENIIKLSQKLGPSQQFIQELDSRRQKEKTDNKSKGQQLNLLDLELKRDICDWQSIYKIIEKQNPKSTANKSKFAHFAIEAAVNLGQWQDAKTWVPYIEDEKKNEQLKVWLTMLSIHSKKYDQAEKMISDIRENMNDKIRQMFSLSYDKSMKGVVILQQVAELEQIVHYERVNKTKKMQNRFIGWQAASRKNQLKELWNDRLQGLKNNLYAMQKVMTVRSMLLQKSEDVNNQIRFCKLALREGQKYLARLTFKKLEKLGIKDKLKSLQLLCIQLEIQILELVNTNEEAFNQIQEKIVAEKLLQDKNSFPLVFEIYEKFAQRAIEEEKLSIDRGNKYLKIFKSFPTLKDYYQLSHYMGLLNIKLLEAVNQDDKKKTKTERRQTVNISLPTLEDQDVSKLQKDSGTETNHNQKKSQYMLGALRCFIKSVTFTQRQNKFFLQDCLKILNLISMGHNTAKLIDQLKVNYMNIPRDGLIEIIPQLIARLDNESPTYKDLMKDIIIYIGKQHPQTLLFPLIYLKKGYKSESKRQIAQELINKIAAHQGHIKNLFEKAEEIADEICKISLKLSEKVFLFMKKIVKIVDDAKMNKDVLVQKLLQFCRNILTQHQKPSSPTEFGFMQQQKSAIFEVVQNLTLYKQLGMDYYFDEAITLIRQIKQRTKQTLSSIKTIYMEEASNRLFKISQSEVFLFGTYSPHHKNITIDSFKNQIEIIHSKQRPKKIVIIGSDQKEYNYLIKGKQDLRLDERIMQLFTFINKMFHSPSDRQSYSIQGYSITPISYQIGIIAWVQNCDTMGSLIQNYRRQNGVLVPSGKLESKLCRHIYPNYPDIEKYHKVEIYHEVCKQISGLDLKYILSKRSETSEKWLKNRSCFIRSLAVMSIVGYIIGLGDRHPFNIMIQRDTWKVVHIDFGDCFQVNKMRKIYPQRVPFRLTRMLVNAMEACKTDGIFQHTCEKIMKILRMNKESILVIVQAFRYDPLFGWKLTSSKQEKEGQVRLEHMEWEGVQAVMLDGEEEKEQKYVYLQKQIQKESTEHILKLIRNKLIGKENEKAQQCLTEAEQVNNLIKEAMNPLNLVQHFENWCIFW